MVKYLCVLALWGMTPLVGAAVVFEFSGSCTASLRHTDCAAFDLADGDLVSGGFEVATEAGSAGRISTLGAGEYKLRFDFGNQHFTELDATSPLSFNVSLDGAGFSSILGNFTNAAGARLTFLTVSTVDIAFGGFAADTFGGGGRWRLAEDSDLFAPVPVPGTALLLGSAFALLPALRRPTPGAP